jgi:hypothetical protein
MRQLDARTFSSRFASPIPHQMAARSANGLDNARRGSAHNVLCDGNRDDPARKFLLSALACARVWLSEEKILSIARQQCTKVQASGTLAHASPTGWAIIKTRLGDVFVTAELLHSCDGGSGPHSSYQVTCLPSVSDKAPFIATDIEYSAEEGWSTVPNRRKPSGATGGGGPGSASTRQSKSARTSGFQGSSGADAWRRRGGGGGRAGAW